MNTDILLLFFIWYFYFFSLDRPISSKKASNNEHTPEEMFGIPAK